MAKHFLTILFTWIFFYTAIAQQNENFYIDSVIKSDTKYLRSKIFNNDFEHLYGSAVKIYSQNKRIDCRNYIEAIEKNITAQVDTINFYYAKIQKLSAIIYNQTGDYIGSYNSFTNELNVLLKLDTICSELATTYLNLAITVLTQDNPEGIEYAKKAIETNLLLNDHEGLINVYSYISKFLSNRNLFNTSSLFLDYCEKLYQEKELDSPLTLWNIYRSKSKNYRLNDKNNEALKYAHSAFQILKNNNIAGDKLGVTAATVALAALGAHQYDTCQKYCLIYKNIFTNMYGTNSPVIANIYKILGELYTESGQSDSAIYYLDKAIDSYSSNYEKDYFYLRSLYNCKAKANSYMGNTHEALINYQKVLCFGENDISDQDSLLGTIPNIDLSESFLDINMPAVLAKANILNELYKKTHDVNYLHQSMDHLYYYDKLITDFSIYQSSNLNDNSTQNNVFQSGLSLLFDNTYQTQDSLFMRKTFQVLNNRKASFLGVELHFNENYCENKVIDSLRQSLVQIDKKIRSEESLLESDSLNFNDILFDICQNNIKKVELKDELTAIAIKDSSNFRPKNINIRKLQELLKTQNSILIDYYYTNKNLFTYLITADDFVLTRTEIDSSFSLYTNLLLRHLKTGNSESESIQALHKILIEPIKQYLDPSKKLVIIPYGIISNIPFDLITSTSNDYKPAEYSISMHYASNFWIKSSKKQRFMDNQVLLVAPVFSKKDQISIDSNLALEDTAHLIADRNENLNPLPFSLKEVRNIERICKNNNIKCSSLTFENANLLQFEQLIPNHSILHIASHGITSKTSSKKTGIFLSPSSNNVTGFVNIDKLYDIKMSANLVVLSACKTGTGKIIEGEGVMALPRGFIYAGVPNVIASLWKVHDEKTKDLMVAFYTHLLEDKVSYAEALRLAKLDCIAKGFLPMDWAGFVLIGN